MWVPVDGTACMGKVRETVCAIADSFNPNNMRIKLIKRIGRIITNELYQILSKPFRLPDIEFKTTECNNLIISLLKAFSIRMFGCF